MRKLIGSKLLGAAKTVVKKIDKKVVNSLAARANKIAGIAGTTAKRGTAARKANKAAQAQVKKASKLFPKNPQSRANAVKTAKSKAAASAARLKRREAARKAGLANQRSAKKTAKNIYKGTLAAGLAGGVGAELYAINKILKNKNTPTKSNTPTKPKTPAKPKAKGKAFNVAALRSAYNKAKTPANKKPKAPLGPKNNPVKKSARPTKSVPTTRNRRNMGQGPKTKVEVGSSIIRDRKGTIKKVTGPSDKTRAIIDSRKKNRGKFARMSQAQASRLRGRERTAYKKWKASKGK